MARPVYDVVQCADAVCDRWRGRRRRLRPGGVKCLWVQRPISVQSPALASHSEKKWLEIRANDRVGQGALKPPAREGPLDFQRQSDWRHKTKGCTARPNELPGNNVSMHRCQYREQLVLGAKGDVVLVQLVCAWAAVASAPPTMIAANAVPRAVYARS